VRIDPQTNRVVAQINLPGAGDSGAVMAADADGLWVPETGAVVRVDPGTGQVVADIRDHVSSAFGVALGFQSVWVGDSDQGVLRIDPRQNEVTAQVPIAGGANTVTTGDGSVWAENDSTVFRIQPG
jgi:streptogramin lyase